MARVLITGAAGQIAQQIVAKLAEHHELVLVDKSRDDRSTGIKALDILSDNGDELSRVMHGVDTVIHLAWVPPRKSAPGADGAPTEPASPWANYEIEKLNIDLAQRVYQTALESGVARVVVGTSNHASAWHETLYYQGLKQTVYPTEYPKPSSLYGWAKVAIESLGFVYASGAFGRELEVVCVRIGVPRVPVFIDEPGFRAPKYFRDLAGYISPGDSARLFQRAIEAKDISDEYDVPFIVVYGISNNTRRYWSLENARRVLGYEPLDDSERLFSEDIAKLG